MIKLIATRRRLLHDVLYPTGGFVGLVRTQEVLLQEMARAETSRRALTSQDPLTQELKWHARQLRIVGDTIAWLALDRHAIRNLGKAPAAAPPSISGQSDGIQVVLERAYSLAEAGNVVVLSDATTVLRNGDIVSSQPDGSILVTECKAAGDSRRSPRVHRQVERGHAVSEYLRTGEAADASFGMSARASRQEPDPIVAFEIGLGREHSVELLSLNAPIG